MTQTNKPFDLEERTAKFGENVIKFCKELKPNVINNPLIFQKITSSLRSKSSV